jgi:BASS family bile acid:Na+ symporter
MLKTVIDVTIPALVFLLMFVVGLELKAEDFRRVVRQLRTVFVATVVPILLWPLVALGVIALLRPQPAIAAGILLVAVCPSGGMANFYTYLGRANLALSVTLTAISTLVAVATMPPLLALLRTRLDEPDALRVPIPPMIGQLILLLVVPVLLGMFASHRWPSFTKRHGLSLLRLGVVALVALIAVVMIQEWAAVSQNFTEILLAVLILSGIIIPSGYLLGRICRLGKREQFALAMVFAVRNVGIATAIAVTVLGRLEFAVFATAYFLNQTPILVVALVLFRRTQGSFPLPPN